RLVERANGRFALLKRDMGAGGRSRERRGQHTGKTPAIVIQHWSAHIFPFGIFMFMPPEAPSGPCAPMPSTASDTFTLPAFSQVSVIGSVSPCLSGPLRSNIIK